MTTMPMGGVKILYKRFKQNIIDLDLDSSRSRSNTIIRNTFPVRPFCLQVVVGCCHDSMVRIR